MAVQMQPQPVAVLQDENTQITRGNIANVMAGKYGSFEEAHQHEVNAWADYEGGIERVKFCGEDMEAMKEHIAQEEVLLTRHLQLRPNYKSLLPPLEEMASLCWVHVEVMAGGGGACNVEDVDSVGDSISG